MSQIFELAAFVRRTQRSPQLLALAEQAEQLATEMAKKDSKIRDLEAEKQAIMGILERERQTIAVPVRSDRKTYMREYMRKRRATVGKTMVDASPDTGQKPA